jgi:hypothetical protein
MASWPSLTELDDTSPDTGADAPVSKGRIRGWSQLTHRPRRQRQGTRPLPLHHGLQVRSPRHSAV